MKRKRYDSTATTRISHKILCLQNGSHVEVQLDDGKWHSGTIIQCQPRKYLVEIGQEQSWIESDLIRPQTKVDQKRTAPFEYRPGQFLRNENKSTTKILADEKVSSSHPDASSVSPQLESSTESKRRRAPAAVAATTASTTSTNNEPKKSPFVWKPSTVSTMQTRRSSKSGYAPSVASEENSSIETRGRRRTLSSSTQQKPTTSNSVKASPEAPPSDVLIFRPIIRFVDPTANDKQPQSSDSSLPERLSSTDDPLDDEIPRLSNGKSSGQHHEYQTRHNRTSKDDDCNASLTNPDLIYHINAATDSRSSSTTSTDTSYLVHPFESIPSTIELQTKPEHKPSCFLETPPPSLPDIHVTQEAESPLDKPLQQLKSKRKQDRPQRKNTPSVLLKHDEHQGQQIHGVLDRLLSKQQDGEELAKTSNDLCDPGYLSDEYGEPTVSNTDSLTCSDLEHFLRRLEGQTDDSSMESLLINEDERIFNEQFIAYLYNQADHYQQIDQYRLEYYNDENNPRIRLISSILKEIFSICFRRNRIPMFDSIPDEIKTHMKLCLNNILDRNSPKKRMHTRGKRLPNFGLKTRTIKTKKQSSTLEPSSDVVMTTATEHAEGMEQQLLLSPASPLTPSSTKMTEELLSPNTTQNNAAGVVETLVALPKERDVYEVIHCLCNCEIDNGFMIQCETCLCWSHCECVGVTTACIPAFFKCSICTTAESERVPQWSHLSVIDDENTSLFLMASTHSRKVSLFLSYSRRLWTLREQMTELKLRYTPALRSLQYALRSDDVMELFKHADQKSDQVHLKIQERQRSRQFFECIAETIDDMIDTVCSSLLTSTCLAIELQPTNVSTTTRRSSNDQINVLISHLCDDEETRQIRLSIENRYEQLMSTVDNQIQSILHEHQSIQTQMQFELGIFANNQFDSYLSYDAHELALRTAIERLKT